MLIDSICPVSRAENSGIHRTREIEGRSGTCETDDENRRRLVDRNVSGFPASDATRRNSYGMNPRRDTRANRELARRDARRILYEARSELSKPASGSESLVRSPRDSASPRNKCRTKLHKPACRAPAASARGRRACPSFPAEEMTLGRRKRKS